jgi:hypothetical protein
VSWPTRFIEHQSPSLLDLILSSDDNRITDIRYISPIGKSDHIVLLFNIECYTDLQGLSEKCVFHKGDYTSISECLENVSWDAELSRCSSVNDKWSYFLKETNQVMEKYPRSGVRPNGKRRKPIWLHNSVYVRYMNDATAACREAKKSFEKRVSADVSESPKAIWNYVSSKTKTKSGIEHLVKDDDTYDSTAHWSVPTLNMPTQSVRLVYARTSVLSRTYKE